MGDVLGKIDVDGGLSEQAAEAAARDVDEPVISFRDVHLSFDRPILKGVSFDLGPGTTKIVLGGSGSGRRRSCASSSAC